jgi:glutamate racemase
MHQAGPIGIFDSGYGGLTVLREIVEQLPAYDYLYLGDNARAPYGTRSFESVYQYTLECVNWLFGQGCSLVILACNTASAKALRTIQQRDLEPGTDKRVLGVIRPTAEVIGNYSHTGKVGVLGTPGTIASESYPIEINKFFPEVEVFQEACAMWVPLIENNEQDTPGADLAVERHISNLLHRSPGIDTILLGCTHYPLMMNKIRAHTPGGIRIIAQGEIVATSLADYLRRHPVLEALCSQGGQRRFFTTDSAPEFNRKGGAFFGQPVLSAHITL